MRAGLPFCLVVAFAGSPVFAQGVTKPAAKAGAPETSAAEKSTAAESAESKPTTADPVVEAPLAAGVESQTTSESADSKPSVKKPATDEKGVAKKTKPASKDDGKVNLINTDFPKGWMYFSAESGTRLADVWRIEKSTDPAKPLLICKGLPEGYLRTSVEFDDFEMGLEWMYPTDENGNSGVLLHMAPKDKIWPDSIQLQLHRPAAGSIFPSGGGKSENALGVRDLSVELTKWNKCTIVSRSGKLTVEVNGKKVGDVTGCSPSRGRIALQSEGSEIHFRNIWIRKLKPEVPEVPKETVKVEPKAADAVVTPKAKPQTTGT